MPSIPSKNRNIKHLGNLNTKET